MASKVNAGCVQTHVAVIYDRGGARRIGILRDLTEITWERVRNQASAASLRIASEKCRAQIETLRQIEPKRHELVIFRGEERVWEGPVIDVQWTSSGMKLFASDVFQYVEESSMTQTWDSTDGGNTSQNMIERFETILRHELSEPYQMTIGTGAAVETIDVPRWENLDPPINLLDYLVVYSGNVPTTSWTEPFDLPLGEHLRNLAQSGLDFTAVGRSLVVWDSATALGQTRTVTEDDFTGDIVVTGGGANLATVSHTVGEPEQDEDGVDLPAPVGHAGGAHPYYGVWERTNSTTSEQGTSGGGTQEALNALAQRDLLGRVPVPLEISTQGVSIILGDTLLLGDLVPGVLIPIRAVWNLREVSQVQVLQSITVTETPTGETVSPVLVPSGDVIIYGEEA